MNVGEKVTYNYTGAIQTFTAEKAGIYKLDVWGGKGGYEDDHATQGGFGGYSSGYVKLRAGETVYVVVGGAGAIGGFGDSGVTNPGGYNGGGSGYSKYSYRGGGGGGATHISKANGLLSNNEAWNNVLIVAGGGGGAANYSRSAGGAGGGIVGGSVTSGSFTAQGGTQTSGYAKGIGQSSTAVDNAGAGAGGGYYGGETVPHIVGGSNLTGGAGGSGYIGGVPEFSYKGVTYSPSTTAGGSQSGKAEITLIVEGIGAPIFLGNSAVDAVYLGSNPIDDIYLGSTPL